MDLTNKGEIERAAQYAKDVIDWAVATKGEYILILLNEYPDKFDKLAEQYNEAYAAFVKKFLKASKAVQKPIIHKAMEIVHNACLLDAYNERRDLMSEMFSRGSAKLNTVND